MRARDIMSRPVDDGVMSIGDEFDDATDRHVATAIAAHEEDDR
jgi:hypothetical protein